MGLIAARMFVLVVVLAFTPSIWRNPDVKSVQVLLWSVNVTIFAALMGWLGGPG